MKNTFTSDKINMLCDLIAHNKANRVKIVVASGGFDPLHLGHVEYMELASKLGNQLIVIANDDNFLIKKKGFVFMPANERMSIIASLRCVDYVVMSIDKDQTVCETLKLLKPNIFAKGGDRTAIEIPEAKICKELNIEIIDGLGAKIQSSSDLVKKLRQR